MKMIDENKIYPFQTPVWGYTLRGELKNIDTYIKTIEAEEESVSKSNFGGFQTKDTLHLNPVFKSLTDNISKITTSITKEYTFVDPTILSLWGNVNYKHSYNGHHTHEGWLSGVFYLKTPKHSGRLVLTNPAIRSEHKLIRNSNYGITPSVGALIIFPSWLEHYVEPNLSDDTRISMSFNVGHA